MLSLACVGALDFALWRCVFRFGVHIVRFWSSGGVRNLGSVVQRNGGRLISCKAFGIGSGVFLSCL